MMLLYGFAAFGAMWWLSKVFVRSDTKAVAKAVKIVGGVLALGLAVLLGVRGRIDMALLLGGFGAWALGWSGFKLPFRWRRPDNGEAIARVRSAMIEMEIDRRSGAVSGNVLAGRYRAAISATSIRHPCARFMPNAASRSRGRGFSRGLF